MTLPEQDPSSGQIEDIDPLFILATPADIIGDIEEMHSKFRVREIVETFDNAKLLAWLEFRLKFLQEELDEGLKALGELKSLQEVTSGDRAMDAHAAIKASDDLVDSMIDLIVVATGTLDGLQVDSDTAWNRVHTANMQKEPGIKASRPNPLGLPDLIKPEGWQAPSHADNIGLLERLVPDSDPEQT